MSPQNHNSIRSQEYIGLDPMNGSDGVTRPRPLNNKVELTETPMLSHNEAPQPELEESDPRSASTKKRFAHKAHLIDSKYAYRQVVVLFLAAIVVGMLSLTWGVFLPRIADDFNASLALAAWPGALCLTLRALGGPISGAWAVRFGSQIVILFGGILTALGLLVSSFTTEVWQLYLTYGLMVGTGLSMCMYPSLGLLVMWFKEKKASMMGLGASGTGIGGLIYAPIASYLNDTLGWRDTFRITAIFILCVIGAAVLLTEDRIPPKRHAKKTKIPWNMFRDGRFTLIFLSNVLFSFGYAAPFFFLISWAEDHGVSSQLAAIASGLLAGANAASKPVTGWIGDKAGRDRVLYSSLAMAGVLLFIWPLCTTTWSIFVFGILYGWSTGGQFAIQACVISDWYKNRDGADLVGLSGSGRALGELVGPVAVGAILAFNPTAAFMMAGAFMMGSAFCVLLAVYWPQITGRNKPDASASYQLQPNWQH
eukprot:Clim_evm6s6 gene=Clim_evmTU6s6